MIRLPESALTNGLKLYRAPTDQYSSGDFDRPDLEPSTLIPMSIVTSWVNPGGAELLKRGDITELTPLGPPSTDVYPGVYPAPADTQDIDYEDRIPRIEYRGDQILRSRSGIRGPAQYWKYGGLRGLGDDIVLRLNQPELDPVMFYDDPSEVAYQTYKGPFLGDSALPFPGDKDVWVAAAQTAVGALIALVGINYVRTEHQKTALTYIGGFAGAIGVVNLISAIAK